MGPFGSFRAPEAETAPERDCNVSLLSQTDGSSAMHQGDRAISEVIYGLAMSTTLGG